MAFGGAHRRGLFDLRRRFDLDLSDPHRRFECNPLDCYFPFQTCFTVQAACYALCLRRSSSFFLFCRSVLLTPGSHGARLDLLKLLLLSTAEMLSPSLPPLLIQMMMLPFMLFPFYQFCGLFAWVGCIQPTGAGAHALIWTCPLGGGVGRLAAGILEILNHYLSQ